MRIIVTITGDAPRWATAGGRGRSSATANWKVSAGEYGRFATAVARRYSGRFGGLPAVRYFTIWNEPNHRNFLKPTSQAPRLYRQDGRRGAAAGPPQRPRRRRGSSWASWRPSGRAPIAMGPKEFLRRWLCLDRALQAHEPRDWLPQVQAHRRGRLRAPSVRADRARAARARRDQHARDPARSRSYLDRARRAKRFTRTLPIYNTEFGLQSNPPDRLVSTSLSRQAALINEKEEYAYRYSRLKSHSQYLLFDDPARPGPLRVKWSGFQTGLRFASGRAKPSYNAYRFPIVVKKRRRGVYVWGRVRPGTGPRFVRLQRKGGSFGPRIGTDPRGYFGVRRRVSGRYRFRAYNVQGNVLGTSRTAGREARRARRAGARPRRGAGRLWRIREPGSDREVAVVGLRGPRRARARR